MLSTLVNYCGFCEEELLMDKPDQHYCDLSAWYREDPDSFTVGTVDNIAYSPIEVAKAEAFLAQYPEFKQDSDLNYNRKVARFTSVEQVDYCAYLDFDSDGFPITYDSFDEVDREAEWDGIYANRDNYQREVLNYWRDVETTRCTLATTWWHFAPGSEFATRGAYVDAPHLPKGFTLNETYAQAYNALDYSEPALNRLSFTELQGFAAQQLIDLNITERYQYRFFNIFVGKDANLHVGLLTIDADSGTVRCGKGNCYFNSNPLAIPTDPNRTEMEAFIHAIIRHGNNHGPDWYVKRQDFAFIHALNCDANHERSVNCNANAPAAPADIFTLDGAIDFLIHHRKFCRDSNCRCTAYYHTLNYYAREAA